MSAKSNALDAYILGGTNAKAVDSYLLAGRVLLSLTYVINGVALISAFNDVTAVMAAKGVPLPSFLLALTIAVWLVGGICLIIGWHTRIAATILFLFLIPVTLVFHPFWAVDPTQMQNELTHFLKNLAILGGLLYVISSGPGRYSLETHT